MEDFGHFQPQQPQPNVALIQQMEQQLAAQLAAHQQQVEQQVAAQIAAQMAALPPVAAPVAPAAPPTPLVKPVPPSAFSGDVKEDVELWLWQVDHWLTAARLSLPIEKITLATGLLRNAALAWWRTREKQPDFPTTWEALQDELRRNFQPINPAETARDKLAALRQRTSALAYATEFRNIAMSIPTITDYEKKDRFIRGLKPRTQDDVRMRAPATFEEAVQMAVRFDVLYRPRGNYGATQGPVPMELGVITRPYNFQGPNKIGRAHV